MRFLICFTFFIYTNLLLAQNNTAAVDFIKIEAEITPIFNLKEIWGTVTYEFETKAKVDSIYIDAFNMTFLYVSLNGKQIEYSNTGEQLILKAPTKTGEHEIFLKYVTRPKQTVYFIGNEKETLTTDYSVETDAYNNLFMKQIWTQGQGKYTSHWLPSFDDMNEKVEFDLTLNVDEGYTVISNGKIQKKYTADGVTGWHFDMLDPMSSYLVAFVIGDFKKKVMKSSSGIPIELYYEPKDSLKVEPTYRYSKEIFDFLENEIGVAYPWQNYKQIPVHDFLYAGMENTTATIFSDRYLIDDTAFVDENYVNVNAHELAHQWFGNLVTEKNGNHHWLHEGFATYYAQLAEKEIFGDDHYYWTLFKSLEQLKKLDERGEGQALTNPKASSLTFYEKGAWALFALRDMIGDSAFKKGVVNYLNTFQFKNVTISDFIKEMELASTTDLTSFIRNWLDNEALPTKEAELLLSKKSEAIKLALEFKTALANLEKDTIDYQKYWEATNSIHLKRQLIAWSHANLPEEIIESALASDTIEIRQALTAPNIIKKLSKVNAETLLHDKSYITIENTLFYLWQTYPDNAKEYLNATKNIIGLPNKNVRLLWLTLTIVTNGYETTNTLSYYKELSSYTSKKYSWETRMGAFQYLNQALDFDYPSLKNLINACTHHSWQFKKYARNLLQELLKNSDYKTRIVTIAKELKGEEALYINTKLKE